MKLQQLRYLAAVAQSDLNITAAAAKLRATQPAVSKQLKLLEEELGFEIFVRAGRAITRITPAGERVIAHALRLLREARNIKGISDELRDYSRGSLAVGTTHTQARYALPEVVRQFRAKYPEVQFHLHQGTSEQIAAMAELDRVDLVITTGAHELFTTYVRLPWYHWRRRFVVPVGHPLAEIVSPSLEQLAAFPLIGDPGASGLEDAFAGAGHRANIVLSARDADVIKTYVRMGLGVGVIADVAIDSAADGDLIVLDTEGLLSSNTTWVGFPRHSLLRTFMYDFLGFMAPHLTRDLVGRAAVCESQEDVDALFAVGAPQRYRATG